MCDIKFQERLSKLHSPRAQRLWVASLKTWSASRGIIIDLILHSRSPSVPADLKSRKRSVAVILSAVDAALSMVIWRACFALAVNLTNSLPNSLVVYIKIIWWTAVVSCHAFSLAL